MSVLFKDFCKNATILGRYFYVSQDSLVLPF